MQTLEEALAIQRKLDVGRGVGYALFELGSTALLQGDTALARKHLEESLHVRTKLGEKLTSADSLAGLSLVALADGGTADAGRLAHDAVAAYEKQDAPDGHAMARTALARSMLAVGRADAALAEANRAQELVRESQNEFVKLTATITAGRIQGRSQPRSAA